MLKIKLLETYEKLTKKLQSVKIGLENQLTSILENYEVFQSTEHVPNRKFMGYLSMLINFRRCFFFWGGLKL